MDKATMSVLKTKTLPQTFPVLPLEDEVIDVLGKAQSGLEISDSILLARAAVSADALAAVRNNDLSDERVLERLAFVLNLHAPSLISMARGTLKPNPIPFFDGFAAFTTPFGDDMTVNAYLLWDRETGEAMSFDTGTACDPILSFVQEKGLKLTKAFITHKHPDHLGDLTRLLSKSGAQGYGSRVENPMQLEPLWDGDGLAVGWLRIRVLSTTGHTSGGVSYFVQGLERPVVIVGDALFAGSMGRAPEAYAEALKNNREQLLTLPPETVIAPGHGPLTTVSEERRHNPFYAQ